MARTQRSLSESSPAPKPKAVKVYLTDEEKQTALERAGGLSLSEYFRRMGLGKRALSPPVPAINRQTYLLLAEVNEALQQLAIAPASASDLAILIPLQESIDQVRWQLIAPDAEGP